MVFMKKVTVGNTTLQIKKFDMKKIAPDATIAVIAKRGSGKSWVIRDILYQHRDMPGAILINPTNRLNHFYDKFLPPLYIYDEFNVDIIPKIFKRQEYILKKNEDRVKRGKKLLDPRLALIMDDCMGDKANWVKEKSVSELFMNGRHYKLFYLISLQYSMGLGPDLRSNFDYVFLLSDNINTNKKRLYDHYAGVFNSFNEFRDVFEQVTQDFGCMVIDNKSKSSKIQDTIFWYKAVDRPPFRIGSNSFVKTHKQLYTGDTNNNNYYSYKRPVQVIVEKMK